MKRLDLVQLTFIIVGICSAFFCIDLVPSFFYYLFAWVTVGLSGGIIMTDFIFTIMMLALYLIFSIVCIKNSKQLALWISNRAGLHGEVNFNFQARDILFVVFVGIAVYGLINYLPPFFSDIYRHFDEQKPDLEQTYLMPKSNREGWFGQLCKIGLLIVLLVYAHVFADFLAARIKNVEPPDDIMQKNN
jgi:hypothetical protein